MEDLKSWQNLWQGVQPEEAGAPARAPAIGALVSKLKQFERRTLRIDRLKTTVVGVILLSMLTFLFLRGGVPPLGGLGLGVVVASTGAFLALYWRVRFRLGAGDLEQPSREFILVALAKLQAVRTLFRRFFPAYALLLLVGLNLFYLGVLTDLKPADRWLWHGGLTLALAAAAAGGMRFRFRRFQRENQPLIDELQAIRREWEGEG